MGGGVLSLVVRRLKAYLRLQASRAGLLDPRQFGTLAADVLASARSDQATGRSPAVLCCEGGLVVGL